MKFDVGVPSGAIKHFVSWSEGGDLHEFAEHAEASGFDSVHVTDHPFPQDEWLGNGGHQAFDPFVALSFMAAVTKRIRSRTNLLVAGYRNPFVMARSIASLDRLAGGRLLVGLGAGYLEPEFEVLGADFAGRGAKFDEAIEAMTAAWTGESVNLLGPHYPVKGHTMTPTPVQSPRPPLWIGGNSTAAKRRAAEVADGWIPMPTTPTLAAITGTAELATFDQLREGVADVRARFEATGRTTPFEVAFSAMGLPAPGEDPSGSKAAEVFEAHAEIGVDWLTLPCRGRSLSACKDELSWLGENVIAPYRKAAGVSAG